VVGGGPSPADRARIARALWAAVPAAAATEIGAVAVMALGVLPGLLVALVALVVLTMALPRLHPPEGVIRAMLLVTGPPLRYALVVLMVWYAWNRGGEGPFLSLLAGLALVLVMPVAATALGILLYGRRGRSPG
jgi:hypothetical protein